MRPLHGRPLNVIKLDFSTMPKRTITVTSIQYCIIAQGDLNDTTIQYRTIAYDGLNDNNNYCYHRITVRVARTHLSRAHI